MNTVAELLAGIQASITQKSQANPTPDEKHGLVLYYYALFKIHGKAQYAGLLRATLTELIAGVLRDDHPAPSVLSFPLLTQLLEEGLVDSRLAADIPRLDACLFDQAARLLNANDGRFMGGALGIIHYFAERLPDPHAQDCLQRLLPPFYALFESQFAHSSRRTVSLGLPDGLSGALLVLMKCYARGLQEEKTRKLVREEILKMISYQSGIDFGEQKYSVFPDAVNKHEGAAHFGNALSWGSGDLNKSIVFHQAGRLFEDPDLEQISNLVGLNTLLRRCSDTTGITDSRFSRGSSGLAETYRFLYQATRVESYRAGYHFWVDQTVKFLRHELEAGFYEGKELDVLDGLVGVALTLLAFNAPTPLKWSHCVLL
jgi:lantibiotic modifying enzyme